MTKQSENKEKQCYVPNAIPRTCGIGNTIQPTTYQDNVSQELGNGDTLEG